MADMEITVRYNSIAAKTALFITVLLLPIWGIAAPIVAGFLLYFAVTTPWPLNIGLLQFLGYFLGALVFPIVGTIATLAFADNRIIADQNALTFPAFCVIGKRKVCWSTITKISYDKIAKKLVIFTKTGKRINLKLKSLKNNELEQLLLSTEVWGGSCEKDLELIELHESLQHPGKTEPSYTQMWEEELSRRYSSTAFMPLEPNTTLQSGRINVVRQLSFGGLSAIYLCMRDQRDLVVLKEAVVPATNKQEVKDKALAF